MDAEAGKDYTVSLAAQVRACCHLMEDASLKLLAGFRLGSSLGKNLRERGEMFGFSTALHISAGPFNPFEEETSAADPTWIQDGSC